MAYKTIVYESKGRIARVMLNRPRYRNAQSRVLLEEMDAAFAQAVADDEVRVIVLGGVGEHFSAGHDLGTPDELEDVARRPYPKGIRGQYQRSWEVNVENSLRWRELPKPTIAMVQGYCIFGGWLIASTMDLIIAADDAKFLPSFVQYFSVPWDLGPRKTKEILFQNRFVSAQEACDLGFVNQVVPRAELEARTLDLASSIAENDRFILRMIKFAVNNAQDAMGFRSAVRAAHSSYFLIETGGRLRTGSGDAPPAMRRLDLVKKAVEKSRK
jgi:enoyl-CoA hydratase